MKWGFPQRLMCLNNWSWALSIVIEDSGTFNGQKPTEESGYLGIGLEFLPPSFTSSLFLLPLLCLLSH